MFEKGVITCTIISKHLEWFENILIQARQNSSIKHIVVQSHLPIIHPVRKVNSSGQFMDHGINSTFIDVMRNYNVDLYLAGKETLCTIDSYCNHNC